MTAGALEKLVDQLNARVQELESQQCRCGTCAHAASERRRNAVSARFAAITALDSQSRTEMLLAMPLAERRAYFDHADGATVALVLTSMPDEQRQLLMDSIPGRYSDLVEIALRVRDQQVPHWVRLSTKDNYSSGWITITKSQAAEYGAALGKHIVKEGTEQYAYVMRMGDTGQAGCVYVSRDQLGPTPPSEHTVTTNMRADEYKARLMIDEVFRDGVDSGSIKVEDCSPEFDRAALAQWMRQTPKHLRTMHV